jgi:hypothetical protein
VSFHENLKQSFRNFKTVYIDSLFSSISDIEDDITSLESEIDTKQDELTAGEGIDITNNVISFNGSVVTDYDDLTNKPQVNGTTLSGNKSLSDLGIVQPTVINETLRFM